MRIKTVNLIRHTQNYEAMLRFYGTALELVVTETWNEPDNRGTIFLLGGTDTRGTIEVVELFHETDSATQPVKGALSLEIEDVDHWHDHLVNSGLAVARSLEEAPWGHRSFGVDDPDGLRIWFYQDIRNLAKPK